MSVQNEVECAAVECSFEGTQFVVVAVYRPPTGDVNTFFKVIESILICVTKENKNITICNNFGHVCMPFIFGV